MKVAVIGLGSMGRRRTRLIKQYDENIEIFGIDSNEERCQSFRDELNMKTYNSIDQMCSENDVKCAFICTSPLSHNPIIKDCLAHNLNVFTEINLVADGYEENIKTAKEKNLCLFLSSTFLYRDEVHYIQNRVKNTKGDLNYIYHIGQYLPDWHPWESYKNFFIGDKRTNGCREIMAIEFPWIINLFGKIKSYHVLKSKNTELDIDYNDNYTILFEHENGNKGLFAADVVSRKTVRNFELYGENLYMTWDGSATGLKEYDYENKKENSIELYEKVDHLDNYASFVVENAYLNEIKAFFEYVVDGKQPVYTFEDDKDVLKMIEDIEN